jgi:all-trans-8'-apo-beta-carotenal 15,15'-oxygenase
MNVVIPESRRRMGRGFLGLDREHGFEPMEVRGTIPDDLRGTLVRNGPSLFESFGHKYQHWLDGDGALSHVAFDSGTARGGVRVTVSPELREEREQKRALYSTGFTLGPSWWRRVGARTKNTANINVLSWQGRVFALTELGLPIEVDPSTLETIGPSDLGGVASDGLNAHVRIDRTTGCTFAIGLSMGLRTELIVYALPTVGPASVVTQIALDHMTIVHDFAQTETRWIFMAHPIHFDIGGAILGTSPAAASSRWAPEEGTEIIVVERRAPHRVSRFKVPAFFHFHYGNAYDRDDGTIVVDLCAYKNPDAFDVMTVERARSGEAWVLASTATLERFVLDVGRSSATRQTICGEAVDFPSTAPSLQGTRHRYLYALLTRDDREHIAMIDCDSGSLVVGDAGPDIFVGEPTFVSKPSAQDERDGWILTNAYDATRNVSGVQIYDGRDLARGPVGSAWFAHPIPYSLHGTWVAREG